MALDSVVNSVVLIKDIVLQERHRIDVDCRRTDRTQPLFSTQTGSPQDDAESYNHKRHLSMSPNVEDFGSQSPSNEHVERLSAVLLTYNFFEKDLGEHFVIAQR